jgi:hypothetical protein
VTREDIQKLAGGYATGSLTDAERRTLFEAALDDQELFDELAREQALKELLETPGAKDRLLAVVEHTVRDKPFWVNGWFWIAALAISIAIGLVVPRYLVPTSSEIETAQEIPPTPPPAVAPPAAPPVTGTATEERKTPAPRRAPATKAQSPAAEPPREVASAPVAEPPASALGGLAGGAPQAAASRAAAPVAAPLPAALKNELQAKATAALQSPFAFDYSITPQRHLHFIPAANGFLSVNVLTGPGNSSVLVSDRPVRAGSAQDVDLPASATQAIVLFTAQARAPEISGSLGGAMDPPSGRKQDPHPSPESRLRAVIPLPRRAP